MVYIFSNAHSYDHKDVFSLKLEDNFKVDKENDKIVFLNTCIPLDCNIKFFRDFKIKYCLCRGFNIGSIISYWGMEFVAHSRKEFTKMFFIDHKDGKLNLTSVTNPNEETKELKIKNTDFFTKYPIDQVPTTGYIAYHLFQELFDCKPEDIMLVNFYGSKNDTTPKDKCHKWDFEEEFFKDKQKIFI